MTEKRYYEKDYDELYYIFDSKTLSEKEFEKKVEYDGYDLFAYSLTPHEVLDLLNENEELKQSKGAKIFNEIVYKNEIKALQKENEKLKKENEQLKRFITSMGFTIEKENGNITRATKEIRR